MPLERFAAVREPSAEPVLGTREEALLTVGGALMAYGAAGEGKTTTAIDGVFHLASGTPWLGFQVPRPLRVLLVENEGPRGMFRAKLKRKLESWQGSSVAGNVYVLEEPWARLSLADAASREALGGFVNVHAIDVFVAGPLLTLGMVGGGTPDEVRAFEEHLSAFRAGLEQPLALWLVHHTNKGGTVSGAWERFPDTLVQIRRGRERCTKLHWEKARWASRIHGTEMELHWLDEGEGLELVGSSGAKESARASERTACLEWLVAYVSENPGQARGVVETAYQKAPDTGSRVLAREIIDSALNGEQHKWLATGPGPAANGVYLYPASQASSPLAVNPSGAPGERPFAMSQAPPERECSPLAANPVGVAESNGEQRAESSDEPEPTLEELIARGMP